MWPNPTNSLTKKNFFVLQLCNTQYIIPSTVFVSMEYLKCCFEADAPIVTIQ